MSNKMAVVLINMAVSLFKTCLKMAKSPASSLINLPMVFQITKEFQTPSRL